MVQTCSISLRATTAGLLLASCLIAVPAIGQEVYKWVDEDGVTHFGHAATSPQHTLAEKNTADASRNYTRDKNRASNTDVATHDRTNRTLAQQSVNGRR
ncbi:MAG: DUF4124 domain-containing protein [Gammaproteobacteria bacterium]|nr:DUF4124 domain-containing protein [Gammaproteobacteria bacterium]